MKRHKVRRRLSGEVALRLACERERCRCGAPATLSWTQKNGAIKRSCVRCH